MDGYLFDSSYSTGQAESKCKLLIKADVLGINVFVDGSTVVMI